MLYKIILDLKKEQECVGDVAGAAFEHPLASTLLSTGEGVMEDSTMCKYFRFFDFTTFRSG